MECWTIESCCHQAILIARAKCSRSDATGHARQLLRQNHKRSIINLMHEQGPRPGRTHWHDSTPHADIWVAAWEAYGVDYDDMPCSTVTGNRTKPSIRPYIIMGQVILTRPILRSRYGPGRIAYWLLARPSPTFDIHAPVHPMFILHADRSHVLDALCSGFLYAKGHALAVVSSWKPPRERRLGCTGRFLFNGNGPIRRD